MIRGLFQTKRLDDILAAAASTEHTLKRTLGWGHVTLLGIGGIIGAGIFATVGEAAAGVGGKAGAGPSLMLSFTITALVCGFTALCYAEFASMVPISGSAYTYAYSTLGELVAWIIGWDLILEYAVGNTAVAISWAGYFKTFLRGCGVDVPIWLAIDYRSAVRDGLVDQLPHVFGVPIAFNVLAFGIVAAITVLLVWGIKESARFNAGMVIVKLIVLAFFVVLAFYYVSPTQMVKNWHPFQPTGWKGTFTGAAVIFFAYIGFDAVSTVAEETRNPKRDLPIGIIASLVICTVIYIVVAGVFSGLMPFEELQKRPKTELAESLTMALDYVAPHQTWATTIVAFGSVVAHTAVLLVFQMGQPRIFFSIARDGLLPPTFARIHPRFKTPHITTILTGVFVGTVAGVSNIDEMVALTNIGTLFAFALVCIGITILRHTDADRPRPFRVPFGAWLLPMLGVASCMFLMLYLPPASWWRFIGWLVLGMSVYLAYGYSHSTVGRKAGRSPFASLGLKAMALGVLLIAIGLFVVPHDALPAEILREAFNPTGATHTHSLYGIVLISIGLVLSAAGAARASTSRR
ncbi:MAG: amino acid permease [Planctomycetes bacterium]|nr:amino acid permease [Planctomycetota bacterium]